jgi:hypothetical protein
LALCREKVRGLGRSSDSFGDALFDVTGAITQMLVARFQDEGIKSTGVIDRPLGLPTNLEPERLTQRVAKQRCFEKVGKKPPTRFIVRVADIVAS